MAEGNDGQLCELLLYTDSRSPSRTIHRFNEPWLLMRQPSGAPYPRLQLEDLSTELELLRTEMQCKERLRQPLVRPVKG